MFYTVLHDGKIRSFSESNMEELLETAVYGGSDHWCCHRKGKLRDVVEGKAKLVIQELGDTMDEYNGKTHELDRDALLTGLKLMTSACPTRHFQNFVDDNADAETGDVFLQLAALGEIVYG